MRFNYLKKWNENNNKELLTLMQIKIVYLFSMGEEGGKVVGNGVVVWGGERLIRMTKLRLLR